MSHSLHLYSFFLLCFFSYFSMNFVILCEPVKGFATFYTLVRFLPVWILWCWVRYGFKSEFGNKEFMIWATVSSWSYFCWLYRASPSNYAYINPLLSLPLSPIPSLWIITGYQSGLPVLYSISHQLSILYCIYVNPIFNIHPTLSLPTVSTSPFSILSTSPFLPCK